LWSGQKGVQDLEGMETTGGDNEALPNEARNPPNGFPRKARVDRHARHDVFASRPWSNM